MADSNFTGLTENTTPAPTDLLAITDDPSGTPVTQKITLASLLKVVNGLDADGSPDLAADYLLAYDASAGAAKKVPMSLVGGSGGGGEGILINGKISVTVASNNLTVAIKTLAGADPSAGDPVTIQINGTEQNITAALSVTKNAGTNWCNAGSAELATKEIDYFVYLGYNATDGVVIGFSRIPYGRIYSDFSATTTNEKYCAISTITNAASGDAYTVIGRFAATLSAGAGYTWSVPTFTAVNLIHQPIYNTRFLTWTPVPTNMSFGDGTLASRYYIDGRAMLVEWSIIFGSTTSISGAISITLPLTSSTSYGGVYASPNGSCRLIDANGNAFEGALFSLTNSLYFSAKNASSTYLYSSAISSTVPFTWTTSDQITLAGVVLFI